jgi:hypothetical protein
MAGRHVSAGHVRLHVRLRVLARDLGASVDDLALAAIDVEPDRDRVLTGADFIPPELAEALRGRFTVAAAAPIEEDEAPTSSNAVAAASLVACFERHGLRRLLVVGGGPGTAKALRELLGTIQLRIIDGEEHRDASQAESELAWADVVAIWGGTILPHKVSKLYTDRRVTYRDKLVTVTRRGVAALCDAVVEHVEPGVGRRAR